MAGAGLGLRLSPVKASGAFSGPDFWRPGLESRCLGGLWSQKGPNKLTAIVNIYLQTPTISTLGVTPFCAKQVQ